MTRTHRHLVICAAAAAVIGVAGCGGSGDKPEGRKLPSATVSQLDQRLDEIQRRYDSATKENNPGACDDIASDSFPAVSKLIDSLPSDTDQKLKDAVTESFSNLQQLTDSGCQDVGTDTETDTTPTETTPPETTPPQTETTPPETDTTPTDTTPKTPPDGGAGGGTKPDPGNGQGNGGSGGNNGNGQGGAQAPGD